MKLVELTDVSMGYRGRALMRPLSLAISRGESWGIVGPNGAGKTTLIRTVLGLLKPVDGAVEFPSGKLRFGYVPQRSSINTGYPLSAFEAAIMGRFGGLGLGRRLSAQDREKTRAELERLGISELGSRPFGSLSGGQQQRVLMARALCNDPDLLVLDEPINGMDLPAQEGILDNIRSLNRKDGLTIVMISHQLETVLEIASHLCLINKDTGLYSCGPVAELATTERLSALYGCPIKVETICGGIHVNAGGAANE
jgi:ABC-type Mn2+/Zn2+ transport system ATPase subunit